VSCILHDLLAKKSGYHFKPTWSAIEPNNNLVGWLANCGLEDEEQSSRGILLVNWNQSGVHLTNVEWDVRQLRDLEGYFDLALASIASMIYTNAESPC
jgi:hypothetical protein